MKKYNLGLFYCDLYGTFASPTTEVGIRERNKEVDSFIEELILIIKKDRLDELRFGFVSASPYQDVKQYLDEFKNRLSHFEDKYVLKIKLNTSFYDIGKILNNLEVEDCSSKGSKALQILRNTSKNIKKKLAEIIKLNNNSLQESNKQLKTKIYYADDCQFNHLLLEQMKKLFNFKELSGVDKPNIESVQFLPKTSYALKDTNLLIKKHYSNSNMISKF